mgnify:CR=1 FL=1
MSDVSDKFAKCLWCQKTIPEDAYDPDPISAGLPLYRLSLTGHRTEGFCEAACAEAWYNATVYSAKEKKSARMDSGFFAK